MEDIIIEAQPDQRVIVVIHDKVILTVKGDTVEISSPNKTVIDGDLEIKGRLHAEKQIVTDRIFVGMGADVNEWMEDDALWEAYLERRGKPEDWKEFLREYLKEE